MIPGNNDKEMGNATSNGRNGVIKTVATVGSWSSILLGSSGILCSVKEGLRVMSTEGKEAEMEGIVSSNLSCLPCLGCSRSQGKATERETQVFAATLYGQVNVA